MNNEKLEEAAAAYANKYSISSNKDGFKNTKEDFIAGATYQSEQDKNEDIELLEWSNDKCVRFSDGNWTIGKDFKTRHTTAELYEQFKTEYNGK